MTAIFDLDPTTLDTDERIAAVLTAEREIARIHARQLRLIAALAADPYPCPGSPAPDLDREWAREELRAALGESAVRVTGRVELAEELSDRLPDTLAALEDGVITLRHARHLADAVARLPDVEAVRIEAEALTFVAAGRDFTAFARKVRREVLKADPRSLEEQIAARLADRRFWTQPEAEGMATVGALLPADGAQAVRLAVDLIAAQAPADDPRSADQRRADALVQLAVDALNGYQGCRHCRGRGENRPEGVASDDTDAASTLPRWQGMRPSIQVTVALSTLVGLDNQPAELDGHGPVPAALARRLAEDPSGTWRRLVTDERGRLLEYGRSTYRPPAPLRQFVMARDRECMFPTCHRQARRCEIDHLQPWAEGGTTCAENLLVLCPRHHHGKHDAGWQVRRLPDGSVEWTSPTGRNYIVAPPAYPADTTVSCVVPDDNNEGPRQRDDRAA